MKNSKTHLLNRATQELHSIKKNTVLMPLTNPYNTTYKNLIGNKKYKFVKFKLFLNDLIFSRAYEMEVPDGYDIFLCHNDFILSTSFTGQYKFQIEY